MKDEEKIAMIVLVVIGLIWNIVIIPNLAIAVINWVFEVNIPHDFLSWFVMWMIVANPFKFEMKFNVKNG